MNLTSLDLNLLVALDAFLLEANVGRAAMRLGLSQPAASHALKRLRGALSDPLLVRVGARMELTPRAQSLRAPLTDALAKVRSVFATNLFDPARSERRFKLMMPDIVVELILPPLIAKIGAQASGVALEVAPWRGPDVMTAEFASSIDLIVSCTGDAFKGFHRQHLYTDSDALAVRHDHPAGARLKRMDAFLDARHIAVVGRGQREDMIDEWLRGEGVERHITLTVPSYIQALHIAARTDLVAFVPRRLISALGNALGLQAVPPPIDPGIDEQFMFHPTRAQVDPGSIWLRKLVMEIGRGLDRPRHRAAA